MYIFDSNSLTCRDYGDRYFSPRKELNYINFKGFRNPLFCQSFTTAKI